MSKHETWRTRAYWKKTGGLLIEEFEVVPKVAGHARRLLDGVIVLNEKPSIHKGKKYPVEGKDVMVIQTKSGRLGMYLMGQAIFSVELLKKHRPKSIRAIAICGKDDDILHPIALQYGIEVVVIPDKNTQKK